MTSFPNRPRTRGTTRQLRSTMSHIPDEIIELIIKPIGNPDRNLLLPLLLVSRRFYEITVPLLYESISAAFRNHSKPYDSPLTTVAPGKFQQLHQSITQKPSLATHISTLMTHGRIGLSASDWNAFRSISSSLTHLRRLYVWASSPLRFGVQLIPPNVKLTHLFLIDPWEEATYNFLRSQSSLEYLYLAPVLYINEESFPAYETITLPNLKILHCDGLFFNMFEAPSLKHLTLSHNGSANPQSPSLRSIRSFMGNAHLWRECAPYCDVIEYVWVQSMHHTFIEDTLRVSSRKIKYLYHVPFFVDDVDCSVLFDAFPELVIVDLDGAELGGFRYRRGCAEPEEFRIPHLDKVDFRHWCELIVDVVEEEIRKNGQTP